MEKQQAIQAPNILIFWILGYRNENKKLKTIEKTNFLNGRSDIQGSVDLQLVDLPAGRDYKVVTANGWETRFIITAQI